MYAISCYCKVKILLDKVTQAAQKDGCRSLHKMSAGVKH